MAAPSEAQLHIVSRSSASLDILLRGFADDAAAAIYATDADGRIIFYNEAAVALWGCRPELGKAEFCGSWRLYWADGRPLPHHECPMAIALREKRVVRNMEAIAERPDGTRVMFVPYPTPAFDEAGELIGAVNMLVDISERKETELAASRLAAIVESSEDAILAKDLDGTITHWNRGAERLFGYSASEVIGRPVTILVPADRHNEEPELIGRIRRGERVNHYETIRRRKDGSLVEISLTVSPIRNINGTIIGASNISRDITERRKAQAMDALLIGEMKHRVRNTLATVQAIAAQTLRSADREEFSAFSARLRALGTAHDTLSRDWNQASLVQIVSSTLHPFNKPDRFKIDLAGDVDLDARQALSLTLALHELATNALKYGALSNASGRVQLRSERQGAKLILRWEESGGPPVKPPTRRGFGSRLIENFLDRGRAEIDYPPSGLTCTVRLDLGER